MSYWASSRSLGRQSSQIGVEEHPGYRRLTTGARAPCQSLASSQHRGAKLRLTFTSAIARAQTEAARHKSASDMDASHTNSCSSAPVKVTAHDNFLAACTLLGGFDTSCFRGYVGTWTSFDIQHSDCGDTSSNDAAPAAAATAAPAAAGAARVTPVLVDETVNFRLFRMEDPAALKYHQVNMYQHGGRPAAASYKAYLASDNAAGRADGYGVREWRHDPSGALWSPDGSSWRCNPSSSTPAEKTLLGLAVADCSLALVNGALPSSFDQQHEPCSWWMEVINKQPGSHARRWGMLHRFDAGRLANTKSMNEDLTEIATEQLHSCYIDPAGIAWQPRRQGSLGEVDALFASQQQQQQQDGAQQPPQQISPQGTATTFTYDEQQQLTMQIGPCTWSSQHISAMNAAAAARNAVGQQQQQPVVVQLDLPDWSYCRLPADVSLLTAAVGQAAEPVLQPCFDDAAVAAVGDDSEDSSSTSSTAAVVFELGTVLLNGSLARWLLSYDAAGSRLLRSATYELYPAAAA